MEQFLLTCVINKLLLIDAFMGAASEVEAEVQCGDVGVDCPVGEEGGERLPRPGGKPQDLCRPCRDNSAPIIKAEAARDEQNLADPTAGVERPRSL